MKLSTAINKADTVYVTLCISGDTIPVKISKAKAKDAMSHWLSTEDDGYGEQFSDEEGHGIAYFDAENGELHLGN